MESGNEKNGKCKKYAYSYEEYEEQGKGAESLVGDILADSDFPALTELVIGDWGNAWEEDCQKILDGIVEQAEHFSHIESLFIDYARGLQQAVGSFAAVEGTDH